MVAPGGQDIHVGAGLDVFVAVQYGNRIVVLLGIAEIPDNWNTRLVIEYYRNTQHILGFRGKQSVGAIG